MQRIAMIGFGAIGRAVLETIQTEPGLKLVQLIVNPGKVKAVQEELSQLGLADMPLVSEALVQDEDMPVDC